MFSFAAQDVPSGTLFSLSLNSHWLVEFLLLVEHLKEPQLEGCLILMWREVQRTLLSLLANRLCLRVKQFLSIFVNSKKENKIKYIAERGHSIYGNAASDSAGITLDMFRSERAYSMRTVSRVTSLKKLILVRCALPYYFSSFSTSSRFLIQACCNLAYISIWHELHGW